MIIDYIKLRGFRSYTEEVIFNFDEGINVIIGANGSGKTTSLKALRLLLLDKSDAILEEFVNRDSTSFYIEMAFSHLGHNYLTSLNYTLKNKVSERELYIDDFETPKFNTTSSVKDYLKTIFDPDLTYYAIALHQGSSEIIKAKDSARLELFKKIRNVDFNKQAEELKVEYDKLTKDTLQKIDLQLIALQNKTYNFTETSNLPYIDSEIEAMNLKIENLIFQINNLKQKDEIESALNNYKLKLQEVDVRKIEKEIEDLREKLDVLVSTHFTEEEDVISELEQLQFEGRKQKIKDDYIEDKSSSNRVIEALNRQIGNIEIKRVRLIDFSEENLSVNKTITEYETEVKQVNKTIESLKSGICPTCGKETTSTELNEYYLTLQKTETELSTTKQKLIELNSRKQENKDEVEVNNLLKEKKQKLQKESDDSLVSLERLREEYERDLLEDEKSVNREIEFNLLKIEQAITNLDHDRLTLEKAIAFNNSLLGKTLVQQEEIKGKKLELEDTIRQYEEKLTHFLDTSVFDLNLEKELLDKKVSTQKDAIAKNMQVEEMNKKLAVEEQADSKKQFEFLKEKDEINNKILLLKEARNILLKHFPNYIISASIEDTENSMNDFLGIVYPKPLGIELKSTATSLKMIYGEGGKKISCKNLSGAENILAGLAFVNSLNQALDLKFIFLDEVDAVLTESNKHILYDSIQKMDYDQMIVITHDVSFQSKFEIDGAKIFDLNTN